MECTFSNIQIMQVNFAEIHVFIEFSNLVEFLGSTFI